VSPTNQAESETPGGRNRSPLAEAICVSVILSDIAIANRGKRAKKPENEGQSRKAVNACAA